MDADRDGVDFDVRPPMPLTEYERTVKAVNAGYDLLFTLTHGFLRALDRPRLRLLVVGAGGGAEIEAFLPVNPGWEITGVDPSGEMLAIADAKAEALGVQDRVRLVRGRVGDLSADERFDAATCLYVLHFLPDDQKLELLAGVAARLASDAPLLAATPARLDAGVLEDDFLGAWQCYGELMGMPADRMASIIGGLRPQVEAAPPPAAYEQWLRDAGFDRTGVFLNVGGNAVVAWIARATPGTPRSRS